MENLNTNTIHDLAQSFADDLDYQKEAEKYIVSLDVCDIDYYDDEYAEIYNEILTDIYFRLKDYFAEFDVHDAPLDDDVNTITEKIIALMDISVDDD